MASYQQLTVRKILTLHFSQKIIGGLRQIFEQISFNFWQNERNDALQIQYRVIKVEESRL